MINTTPKYLDIAQHNNTTTDLPLIPSPNTILETRPRVAKLLLSRTYPSNQAASSKQRTERQQREKSASILPLYPSRPPCSSSGNPSDTVRLAVPCANSLAALSRTTTALSITRTHSHSRGLYRATPNHPNPRATAAYKARETSDTAKYRDISPFSHLR